MRFTIKLGSGPLLLVAMLALPACTSSGSGGSDMGSTLGNMLRYGSTTEPPLARAVEVEATECPAVTVADGGAALRRGTSQISIANVARECIERAGGAISVKVGLEGRALLGAGGGGGRFDVPVTFQIKRGDRVIVSRLKRVAVTIPANDTQSSFMAIESDMIVPPGTGEYEIEVGLGGAAAAASPRRRRG
ncbi:hypothetical protein [uncultured Enterovirga sp.]|uniref:hypothetical protein n=1 Tax=uncultured Enterovirga sp. TaxID=2026352 RepID=UPI0035CB9190